MKLFGNNMFLVETEIMIFKVAVDRNIGLNCELLVSNFVLIIVNDILDVKLKMDTFDFWLILRVGISFVVEQEKSCLVTAEEFLFFHLFSDFFLDFFIHFDFFKNITFDIVDLYLFHPGLKFVHIRFFQSAGRSSIVI